MRVFKFDMKSLGEKHAQYKAIENSTQLNTVHDQIAFVLQAARGLDRTACQRAYEEQFLKTGSFTTHTPPDVCYSHELKIPHGGYDQPLLDFELRKNIKGFRLTSCSMYDDGPRIIIEPDHFSFDKDRLERERNVSLAKQKEAETAVINHVVPILISDVMAINIQYCFESFNRVFETNGRFPTSVLEGRTREVRLDMPVPPNDLVISFFKAFVNTDGRTVNVSSHQLNGIQYAQAYITTEMFQ